MNSVIPDKIKVIASEVNKGAFLNYVCLHKEAVGELVAHMDGDDLAYPEKFSAQVAYMDSNPECAVVWHKREFLMRR